MILLTGVSKVILFFIKFIGGTGCNSKIKASQVTMTKKLENSHNATNDPGQ